MAYTTQKDLEIPAGGYAALVQLADNDKDGKPDPEVIQRAQTVTDSWIDGYARRLYSNAPGLPFRPTPDAIRSLAADETVYRLRFWRRAVTEEDKLSRLEREATLKALEAGTWNPLDTDVYPIGPGDGTPAVVELQRTGSGVTSSSGDAGGDFGRAGTKGYW